ncbi:MAG TPA: hypothetical protein VGL35_09480 [Rhizomicrobium sp.]|jgi:hypothetical protein
MTLREVNLLTKEYARLLGRYERIEREIEYVVGVENILNEIDRITREKRQMRARLDQIAAIVEQLEPGWVRERVRPISPRKNKIGTFSKIVYQILRETKKPLRTREIAWLMAARLKIKPDDQELRKLDAHVMGALRPRIGKTIIVVSEKPRQWAVMPRDQVIAALRASQAKPALQGTVVPLQPKAIRSDSRSTVSEPPPHPQQSRIAGSRA